VIAYDWWALECQPSLLAPRVAKDLMKSTSEWSLRNQEDCKENHEDD